MKKLIALFISVALVCAVQGQLQHQHLGNLIEFLKKNGNSSREINDVVNGIIKDPELYNELWKKFLDLSFIKENKKLNFLPDLNIKFKTFQGQDSAVTSLGFAYDLTFDFARFTDDNSRRSQDLGFTAMGNVAFKKKLNPNDFLESRLHYNFSFFKGGVIANTDTAVLDKLNDIEKRLARLNDMQSPEAIALWDEFGRYLKLTDQYFFAVSPKFALESSQDFSKRQLTPGMIIGLGAKGWNSNSTLSKLNLLDYPFALLRLITGTDRRFTPYGATLPALQLGFDYVIPTDDTLREKMLDDTKPFPRFKLEAGFRTFISRIGKENIFFNANFRYYQEIGAKDVIKDARLASQTYFVMAIQSTSGMFVSYANGKLPFDARNDEVYSIGFNYKF